MNVMFFHFLLSMTATIDRFSKLHNRQPTEGRRGRSFSLSSYEGCYDECKSLDPRYRACHGFMFDRFRNNCTIFDYTSSIKFVVEIAVGKDLYIRQWASSGE